MDPERATALCGELRDMLNSGNLTQETVLESVFTLDKAGIETSFRVLHRTENQIEVEVEINLPSPELVDE